ncbi:MAG: hypothetical protein QF535_07700 [Anaerolineales bacterium]|nr:hypothetical protein [Anaerolineales bacterium]
MRRRYIGIAKSLDANTEIVIFPKTSLETHAKRRAQSDSRGMSYEDWLEAAQTHSDKYEEPSELDGADNIILSDFKI